jgi:hypothetical protein
MAGFIRGVVLIGVMAVYSPVHLGNDRSSWTESAALVGAIGEAAAPGARGGEAMLALARENGPALARKLAELDPKTRQLVLDMSIAAASRMQADGKGSGEGKGSGGGLSPRDARPRP